VSGLVFCQLTTTPYTLFASIRNQGTARRKKTSRRDVSNASPPSQLTSTPRSSSSTAVGSLPPFSATALEDMTTVTDLEVETALRDSASVELTYQQAINGNGDDDDDDDSEDDEDEADLDQGNEGNTECIGDAMGWVDSFIFNTRRKGGRQTETSVIKLYKVSTLHGRPWFLHAHRLTSGMVTWRPS
jgi:hypothetical protein